MNSGITGDRDDGGIVLNRHPLYRGRWGTTVGYRGDLQLYRPGLRRERIGFVFQAFNLVPTLTAQENVVLPLTLGGKKPDRAWVEELARALGIADRLAHRPAELSGGQQQRVATARALITRPDLIFADEPTGNLDSKSATELLTQIRQAVDEYSQTVVMVTHDPRAAAYADRVLFLADGRLVRELPEPTADRVLDAIRELSEDG